MNYLEITKKTIELVEENLKSNFSLSHFSEYFNTTKYHYDRIFKTITGLSIVDYYRKRKISAAAYDLQHSDKNILYVALDYGYNSHEAFSRAFKKLMNVNPKLIKTGKVHPKMFPKLEIIERNFKNFDNAILVDNAIRTQKETVLWGIKERIAFKDDIVETKTIHTVNYLLEHSKFLEKYYFVYFPNSVYGKNLHYGLFVRNHEKEKVDLNLVKLVLPEMNYLEIEYEGKMEINWKNVLNDIHMITSKKRLPTNEDHILFYQLYSIKDAPRMKFKIYIPLKKN